MGIKWTFDYSKADPEAHNYAVSELKKRFKPGEKCTLLDYIRLYAKKLSEKNGPKS